MGPARIPGLPRAAPPAAACPPVALLAVLAALVAVLLTPGQVAAADPSPEPVRLPPITAFSVGDEHGCALVQGGEVWCSGRGFNGQLGDGAMESSDAPVQAKLPRPAIAIEVGGDSSCAITDDGVAWCWGANEYGQLGIGTKVDTGLPTRLDLPGRAVALAFGTDWHACALLDDGSARCWGHDDFGQLGDGGDVDAQPDPVRVTVVGEPIAQIAAGFVHTCALLRSGAVACWGAGSSGELGDGVRGYPEGAVRVQGISGTIEQIAASYDTSCAVVDGRVLCWGGNEEGRLGTGSGLEYELTPTPVAGLPDGIAEITMAESGGHICARSEDGTTWCWGNAEVGQLGEGVPSEPAWVTTPVRLDLPPATAISAGSSDTCALFAPDDVRCWGAGDPVARNPWTGETGAPAGGFREPGPLVPTLTTYIPTPRDVSTDPPVVGANLLLAALVMILFTIAGELLNRTLAENEDAFARRGGALAGLRRLRARFDTALGRVLGRGRRLVAVQLAGIAAIYGLVFSLLDRTWDPFSVTGLWLFLSMAIAFGIVGIADDLACWSVARRWGVAADLDLRPGNLVVAVTSTLASRVAVLLPGVMVGMPEALEVDADALDERRRARLAGVGLGTLAAIGLGAWAVTLGTSLLGELGEGATALVGGVEAFFLVVFAVTVQNGFTQMLAFRGTPGRILRTSHRWLWLFALLAVTFLFWHTLVNPRGDLATALSETNVVAFVATAVGFVLVSGCAWLWFTVRRRRARPVEATVPAPAAALVPLAAVPLAASAEPAPERLLVMSPSAEPTPASEPMPAAEPAPAPKAAPAPSLEATAPDRLPAAPVTRVVHPARAAEAAAAHPILEFELTAVGDRRLRGRVRLLLRPGSAGVAGTWISARADRLERVAGVAATLLLVLGLLAILLLTTVPGFRFYRVPWLIPSAVAAAAVIVVALILLGLWRSRQRWSGEVVAPAELLVGVRRSFNRGPLIAACILLTPIGGALYAALVGQTVVRLRGPFDPERTAVVEVRLRCRDRDEATDVAARVAAIRGAVSAPTGGWQ